MKTSQAEKKIRGEGGGGGGGAVAGSGWGEGGGVEVYGCLDVWVGVWDDGSGLRSEGGSEG